MRLRRSVLVLAFLLATRLVTVAAPAEAYRTLADSTFCAEEGCAETGVPRLALPVSYELEGSGSDDLSYSEVEGAVREAYEDWAEPMCTAMELRYGGATSLGAVYADDHSVVTWIEAGWGGLGYSTFELGVTTQHVSFREGRWVLVSADTALNGVDYSWHLETTSAFDGEATVGDVVRHEAGHALGIEHPCEFGVAGVPDCASIGSTLGETPAMWPRSRDGGRDDLKPDDVAAICWLYPATTCPTVPCAADERCIDGVCALLSSDDAGTAGDAGMTPGDAATGRDADVARPTTDGGATAPSPREGGCSAVGEVTVGPMSGWALLFGALFLRRRR